MPFDLNNKMLHVLCQKRKNVKSLSFVQLFPTPWTVAYQAPPSKGCSRQEYWSGLPVPSPVDTLKVPWKSGREGSTLFGKAAGFLLWVKSFIVLMKKRKEIVYGEDKVTPESA